jgi:hypothetical protein
MPDLSCKRCGSPIPPESDHCIFCTSPDEGESRRRSGSRRRVCKDTDAHGSSSSMVHIEYVYECPTHGRVRIKAKVLAQSVRCPFCCQESSK